MRKIILIFCIGIISIGCSSQRITIDSASEDDITALNNRIRTSRTTVYLLNGKALIGGDFLFDQDSVSHSKNETTSRYANSEIRSIKTIENHSQSTFLGISLILGGVAVHAVTKEDQICCYESPNQMEESRTERLTENLKGSLIAGILSVSGLIVLISGVKEATKSYFIK